MARRGGEGTGAAPQEAWGTLSSYVQHSRSLGLSVTLSLPLVVLYQVGIVQRGSPVGNIAYVWLTGPFSLLGAHASTGVNLCVIGAMVLALWDAERRGALSVAYMAVMLLESLLYALLMFSGVLVATRLIYGAVETYLSMGGVPGRLLLLSLGAGVYEELLFRALLVGGGALAMRKLFEFNRFWALAAAVLVSSLLFAAVHHLGTMGEEFNGFVFLFRTLCGVMLGIIYATRGLGIAVWTHAFYNVLVLLQRYG